MSHFKLSRCFFFFKQKTAYEMRISDWSSDVCSSDLQNTGLFWLARKPASINGPPASAPYASIRACAQPAPKRCDHCCSGRDRKSVVQGKSVSVRLALGGRRFIHKKYISNLDQIKIALSCQLSERHTEYKTDLT